MSPVKTKEWGDAAYQQPLAAQGRIHTTIRCFLPYIQIILTIEEFSICNKNFSQFHPHLFCRYPLILRSSCRMHAVQKFPK